VFIEKQSGLKSSKKNRAPTSLNVRMQWARDVRRKNILCLFPLEQDRLGAMVLYCSLHLSHGNSLIKRLATWRS